MKASRLKRPFLFLLSALLLAAIALLIWSKTPIRVDVNKPDPAVQLANEIGKEGVPYTEGYVGQPGSRIHYVSAGQGDPIIFVHGFPSYWFDMFGLMEAFKNDHRVIAIDGLGVGKSEAPRAVDDYKIDKLIRGVDQLVTELGLDEVHLVGHDWGVAITAGYAQANPSKVKSLTTMSALPHNVLMSRIENDAAHQELFSYAFEFSRANPVLIKALGIKNQIWDDIYAPLIEQNLMSKAQGERFRKDVGNAKRLNHFIHWYRANFPEFDKIEDGDFWPSRNARLTVPAIFMYGDNDPVVTDALVKDFKNISDSLKVIRFENTAHRPHYEKREEVIANIRDLIGSE